MSKAKRIFREREEGTRKKANQKAMYGLQSGTYSTYYNQKSNKTILKRYGGASGVKTPSKEMQEYLRFMYGGQQIRDRQPSGSNSNRAMTKARIKYLNDMGHNKVSIHRQKHFTKSIRQVNKD